jgi:hypothetical protein
MFLSLILIIAALYWLMRETHYLTIRLAIGSIPVQCIEQHKHNPILEPCRIVNAPYPKAEPIKLISQYCGFTELQRKIIKEKWRVDADNPYHYNTYAWQISASYQQMNIGGHTLTLLATSSKLYDTIAEFQKIVDGKDRKPALKQAPLMPLIEQIRTGSEKVQHGMRGGRKYYEYETTYETQYNDCLCGKEWLKAHINDVIPEPTIDLVVNGNEMHFNGNFKTGCVHDFMVLNAELWEKPRIRGRKVKPIESVAPVENKELEEVTP